ncbi:hypothetical protein BBD42_29480 [Paenibacillus sp. BIHB 4019]|uniref:Lipoprotein SmpA/OmlA domain-containing protein n=1 Tax=Paenibacillus sp. BIHB 4019 TaxID=1870819 RepID=A0A1B2DR45_9BACL|nr:hypothetical protein [Paenibacillus sp. BIHB 4019]ANY70176.1 hypothetical protein BBD42_29480 [Paenibacillus sp. BIHB 4019]
MKKIIISFLMLLIICSCSSQFDKETWLKEPEKRQDMVSSLTNKFKLKGMTENEIIDLLGEPAEKLSEPSRQFLYYIGSAGLGIKVTLLQLQLDENGKVESHDIIYK